MIALHRRPRSLSGTVRAGIQASSPRGYSLIEMVVVIAILGSLLSFTGIMLYRLLRTEQVQQEDYQSLRAFQTLENRFRSDVRLCHSASVQPDGLSLTLQMSPGGDHIIYRIQGDTVERRSGAATGTGHNQLIDSFRLKSCKPLFRMEYPLIDAASRQKLGICVMRVDYPLRRGLPSLTGDRMTTIEVRATLNAVGRLEV